MFVFVILCAVNHLQLLFYANILTSCEKINHIRMTCRQSDGILDGVDKRRAVKHEQPTSSMDRCCYLHCNLPHSSCVEVTERWGLAHVERDSESASTIPDSLFLCCASFMSYSVT